MIGSVYRAYTDLPDLPLLITFKIHGAWPLFETRHLQRAPTNDTLSLGREFQGNLPGLLAEGSPKRSNPAPAKCQLRPIGTPMPTPCRRATPSRGT